MMKFNVMLATLALVLAVGAAPAFAQAVDGEVMKVDQSAGKITIKHGPMKQFDMDAMTMVFRARDSDALKTMKVGDKIKFVPERIDGQFTATRIEKAK
jgi:Cu(I)/Ag(I) efflux system periplasmic protein CusF